VVLTTHVNADGDGTGSEAAIAAWLISPGKHGDDRQPDAVPGHVPVPGGGRDDHRGRGHAAGDRGAGRGGPAHRARHCGARADRPCRQKAAHDGPSCHRPSRGDSDDARSVASCFRTRPRAPRANSCTTCCSWRLPRPWPQSALEGLYTAIVTDTGSFRFANTTPRAHAIAGDLIEQGVDPELDVPAHLRDGAAAPVELLRHALEHSRSDAEHAITWITIERGVMERLGATSEDLDGVVEHARSIEGTEVAILFRETMPTAPPRSRFRSAGATRCERIARQFGGGGHVKASGALLRRLQPARDRRSLAVRAAARAAAPDAAGHRNG
jgi:bifunctional oligoribonuclease and PAP phosphatase NrnA